jgi:opacity protein-like surface antigen
MAIAAVAAGAGAANASAATLTEDVPVAGSVTNECTGEAIVIDGTAHLKVTDNSSLAGTKSQMEWNLTGVKGIAMLTGVRYVMNYQTSEMLHADLDDAQQTTEHTIILTRQGETVGPLPIGDDFRVHVIIHLTVTNGVTRADKIDLQGGCR